MKVTIGTVEKMIPQEYVGGLKLVHPGQLDQPDKLRLSPWERFLLADAQWRWSLQFNDWHTYVYLENDKPVKAQWQRNRVGDLRPVVVYENGTVAVCRNHVANVYQTAETVDFDFTT